MVRFHRILILLLASGFIVSCPVNSEDAMMWKLYHQWHDKIAFAVGGTDISEEYMAAIISLESHPPGNPKSKRFERKIYERLVELRDESRPFGNISQKNVKGLTDDQLMAYATSYGLTQVMGYHCFQLGCTIAELKSEDHLIWAIAYMQLSYRKPAQKKDWESCFRIHNTGKKDGTTSRKDYVKRGLIRMNYYTKWMEKNGQFIP